MGRMAYWKDGLLEGWSIARMAYWKDGIVIGRMAYCAARSEFTPEYTPEYLLFLGSHAY